MGSEAEGILDKISSYNLFNNLLPGIVFVVLADKITRYTFIQQDIVIGLFLYYFIGLVVGRVGSLVIEPLLKSLSFVKFADYKDIIAVSKTDEKMEVLFEANNSYRTLCSVFILLLLLKLYERIEGYWPVLKDYNVIMLLGLLTVTLLFSYRKQTQYITKRIETEGR